MIKKPQSSITDLPSHHSSINSFTDAATQSFGPDAGTVVKGDAFVDPTAALRFVLSSLVAVPSDGNGNNNALLTDGARRLLQQLQGSSSDGRSSTNRGRNLLSETDVSHSSNHNGEDAGHNTMKNAMSGFSSMTESESDVMKTTATVVAEKLRDRLVERLQPLKQQSSSQRRGVFA